MILQHSSTIYRRRASVLVLVLTAIVIMSLTTSSYLLLMRNEHLAARYSNNHRQAQLLADSGLDYLRVLLTQSQSDLQLQGGIHSNVSLLQEVIVVEDAMPAYQGRFTVVAPDMLQGDYQGIRYGLENESSKLNLNSLVEESTETVGFSPSNSSAGNSSNSDSSDNNSSGGGSITEESTLDPRDRLLFLPGMTDEIADAILDWIDSDDDPRSYGAEADYYQSLAQPYQPANRPFRYLDELLMVRGVTRELLYGLDANRNFQIDPQEQASTALEQFDNTQGQLNRGWSAYLTVVSAETSSTPYGEAKINVNGDDLETLHGELVEAVGTAEANFIIAFRQFGAAQSNEDSSAPISGRSGGSSNGANEVTSADSVDINFEQEAQQNIESLLDLLDARVTMTNQDDNTSQTIESPWSSEGGSLRLEFADLLDVATSDSEQRVVGRININLASRAVLLTIPGMTEILADQILTSREIDVDLVAGLQRHPIWLVAQELMTLEQFKPMAQLLTTGGDVYSCQIAGFFDANTPRARVRAVLQRSGDQTKLLEWENLNRLGPGFSRSILSTFIE